MEAAQMSINWQVIEHNEHQSLSNKKGWKTDTCYNMEERHAHWKEVKHKRSHFAWFHSNEVSRKCKSIRRHIASWFWAWRVRNKDWLPVDMKDLIEVTELLKNWILVMVAKSSKLTPPPKSLNYTVKMGNFHGMQITLQWNYLLKWI